jgi:outer membrane protein OmpA-like peptidoglycan-associated protein
VKKPEEAPKLPAPPAPAPAKTEAPVIPAQGFDKPEPAKPAPVDTKAPLPPIPPAAELKPALVPPPLPAAPKPPAGSITPEKPAGSAAVDATTKAIAAPIHKVEEMPSKPLETAKPPEPVPPAAKTGDKEPPALRITFKSTETTVPLSVKESLDKVAKQLIQNDALHVTLIAYASSVDGQASMSRRVSLSRALSVRAYLIDAGVSNMRINVQAEGDKNPGGDPDRVDMVFQSSDKDKAP